MYKIWYFAYATHAPDHVYTGSNIDSGWDACIVHHGTAIREYAAADAYEQLAAGNNVILPGGVLVCVRDPRP